MHSNLTAALAASRVQDAESLARRSARSEGHYPEGAHSGAGASATRALRRYFGHAPTAHGFSLHRPNR